MSDYVLFILTPFASALVLAVRGTFLIIQKTSMPSATSGRSLAARADRTVWRMWSLAGLLGLVIGHLLLIAWPSGTLWWSRDMHRLISLEGALIVCGVTALISVARAVRRGVLQPNARSSGPGHAAFLGVLLVTMISGLGIAVFYRWAAVWSAVTVTPYVRTLAGFEPNLDSIRTAPYLVRLHIFSSFLAIVGIAFTAFMDRPLNAVSHAARTVVEPVSTAFDRSWRSARESTLRLLRRLLWPEEER